MDWIGCFLLVAVIFFGLIACLRAGRYVWQWYAWGRCKRRFRKWDEWCRDGRVGPNPSPLPKPEKLKYSGCRVAMLAEAEWRTSQRKQREAQCKPINDGLAVLCSRSQENIEAIFRRVLAEAEANRCKSK